MEKINYPQSHKGEEEAVIEHIILNKLNDVLSSPPQD